MGLFLVVAFELSLERSVLQIFFIIILAANAKLVTLGYLGIVVVLVELRSENHATVVAGVGPQFQPHA